MQYNNPSNSCTEGFWDVHKQICIHFQAMIKYKQKELNKQIENQTLA